jgi:two-component system CheB/CheR fusion protein
MWAAPITDIATKVELPNLANVVMDVIDTLATTQIEATDKDAHFWSVRIQPYKTTDNKIDGAIVALVDIDAIQTSLNRSNQARELAETIVNTVRHPLVVLDQDLTVRQVNESFLRIRSR